MTERDVVAVHGAWRGGWCWRAMRDPMASMACRLHPLTLTGCGDRAHLLTVDSGLDQHIEDVVRYLDIEDLRDVVLVGHSYGCMVITGVADVLSKRLAALVFVDGPVPTNGQSLVDTTPVLAPLLSQSLVKRADGVDVITPPPLPPESLNTADQAAWLSSKLTDMAARSFADPLKIDLPPRAGIATTYVACAAAPALADNLDTARTTDSSIRWHTLETSHDAMITEPDALARIVASA